jgi:hypothetical protein
MGFLEAVELYFRGERVTGVLMIPVGIVAIASGVYLWRVHGAPTARGMGIPLLLVGLGMAVGGGLLVRTVNARQAQLSARFDEDPAAPVAAEIARIEKVNSNWLPLKIAWAGLAAIAFVLVFAVSRQWVHGVALALLMVAAALMVVDTFAEQRAEVYESNLQALADRPAQ